MKKKVFTLLFALVAIATTAQAQVVLNETNFPDANFRADLAKILGISEGDEITEKIIATTTSLNLSKTETDNEKISDLTGIEHFTKLTYLNVDYNNLDTLDLTRNKNIEVLWCRYANLELLNISQNFTLKELILFGNRLSSLDVSKNTMLTYLLCSANRLISLDISQNTALKSLFCSSNQLTSLDVSKNTKLEVLECMYNSLTILDVSKHTALRYLSCFSNRLISLDVSGCTALTSLTCMVNQIKGEAMNSLIAGLPKVNYGKFNVGWFVDGNEKNICTKEQVAAAYAKGWTVYANLGNDTEEEYEGDTPSGVFLTEKYFPNANFRAALSEEFDIEFGNEFYMSQIRYNRYINVSGKAITDLSGIEHFTALTDLSCSDNQLTSLDVSKNTALTYLSCSRNQLTSLDVSQNTALRYLYCTNNQLTALDVSQNTALRYLYCDNNQLTSLDVSKNTALELLECIGNQLTSLDVSKNTWLKWLHCHNNQIKGEAMDALVASLPTVEWGRFYVIDTKDKKEGNVCTKSQVAVAKEKGWKVIDYFGGGIFDEETWSYVYPEYEGSDPSAVEAIKANSEKQNAHWYTIDGVKLSSEPTKKGVYIIKGKKVKR